MFKKIILILIFSLITFQPLFAQESLKEEIATISQEVAKEEVKKEEPKEKIKPVILSENSASVDKKILFDASDSVLTIIPAETNYQWNFGDNSLIAKEKEVLHSFKNSGKYVVELTIQQGDQIVKTSKEIFVYDKKIFLVTDRAKQKGLALITNQAENNGVLLKIISSAVEKTGFLTEEKLVQTIKEEDEFINSSDALIFYSASSLGLKAFTRYWQSVDIKPNLKNKLIVKITDESMTVGAEITQQNFNVISPTFILLTRKESFNPIFESKDYTQIVSVLSKRGIENRIINERTKRSKLFILSNLVTNFIANGIPANTLYLILAFPFITFIIAFARQILGVSTFGVYTPTVLSVTFLILGIYFGVGALFVVVLVSYVLRLLLNKFELLYTPRISLVLSVNTLSFFIIIWFLLKFGSPVAIPLAIFPLIVMSTISEKFTAAQSEEGLRGALFGALETVLVAVVAYYFVTWTSFSNLLSSLPELIFVPLLGNIVLGKFTNLRLAEYFRFRSLFKDQMEE